MLNSPDSSLVPIEADVFETLASNAVLMGSLEDLARQFDTAPARFLECLNHLIEAGWVTMTEELPEHFRLQLRS